jgi:chromate reductase
VRGRERGLRRRIDLEAVGGIGLRIASKNAIDHASRPYGKSAWAGKPAGVLGASVGAIGTAMAQQHLRILAHLDVPTLGQPEAFIHADATLFDSAGKLGERQKKFLQAWMDRYVAWVKWHAA